MSLQPRYHWHRPDESKPCYVLYDEGDVVGTAELKDGKYVLRHSGYMLGRFNSTQGAEEALEKWMKSLSS